MAAAVEHATGERLVRRDGTLKRLLALSDSFDPMLVIALAGATKNRYTAPSRELGPFFGGDEKGMTTCNRFANNKVAAENVIERVREICIPIPYMQHHLCPAIQQNDKLPLPVALPQPFMTM
eukprot:1010382-Pleurochrysis_carterae.AAC.2